MSLGINRFEEKMVSLMCWHKRDALGSAFLIPSPRGNLYFKEVEFRTFRKPCWKETWNSGITQT